MEKRMISTEFTEEEKGIGGAQRFPQNGWKPFEECKGRRELNCEGDGPSR